MKKYLSISLNFQKKIGFNFFHHLLFFAFAFFITLIQLSAQTTSPYLVRSTVAASGFSEKISIDNNTYIIQQSLGQTSNIGTFILHEYVVRQGFIHPDVSTKYVNAHLELKLEVAVYPNPFSESISLSFDESINGDVLVVVYDLNGQVVYTNQYENTLNILINLSDISNAHYILKIQFQDKLLMKRIIKRTL